MRRLVATAGIVVVVVLGSVALAGCGDQNGVALAQEACVHIDRALLLYDLAQKNPDQKEAHKQFGEAAQQLNLAEPLAAAANSSDGRWGALMTTLSERNEVDIAHLAPSLRAQCTTAKQGVNGQGGGGPPTTFPSDVHVSPTTNSSVTTTTTSLK
jgi:hypothetical protein